MDFVSMEITELLSGFVRLLLGQRLLSLSIISQSLCLLSPALQKGVNSDHRNTEPIGDAGRDKQISSALHLGLPASNPVSARISQAHF